ncbi:hypothetical protein BABINDRAFT_8742 [Babjeviella inositovora NRRL Y-12698]|uniref:Exosome complex component CSL4 C-terminal domain-containing protein n=1 Tax=Babjeviella inositovora NRRL Y-12698 TaxID=984486 RepID=A0A1E3QQB4_9ASCO|nr:uncharacterized protein BABINDRAFT_8742 [Babjeviella inositovora NRRL Y-12698]ODQ79147.1 hypothetical protein BABINDRAFT_8742 [Babjeviella inositovora NRRL Y-12698]
MSAIPEFAFPGQPLVPTYELVSTKQVKRFQAGKGTKLVKLEITKGHRLVEVPTIVATILGKVVVVEREAPETEEADNDALNVKTYVVSVLPKGQSVETVDLSAGLDDAIVSSNLPQEGDIILCRVTKLTLRQAFVEILAVEARGVVSKDGGVGHNGSGEVASGGGSGALTSSLATANTAPTHAIASDLGETFKGLIRSQDVRSTNRDAVKMIESFRPGDIVRALIISLGDGSNYYLSTARNDLGVVFAKAHSGAGGLMYAVDWQTMVCAQTGETELRKCAKPF